MRSGDLVKRRYEGRREGDPNRDTHRGRLRVQNIMDGRGMKEGVKLVLILKPNKTDPSGERGFVKGSVIYREERALYAGESMWRMLKEDPE